MTCQSAALGNNAAAGLPVFMLRRSERAPLLPPRPGSEVNMDLWTYPMIIPGAVSCEAGVNRAGGGERGGGGGGGRFYRRRREEGRQKKEAERMMRER